MELIQMKASEENSYRMNGGLVWVCQNVDYNGFGHSVSSRNKGMEVENYYATLSLLKKGKNQHRKWGSYLQLRI